MTEHTEERLHSRSLVLLFAPSGCCLRDAENLLRQKGIVVYDIEDEMKSIPEFQEQLRQKQLRSYKGPVKDTQVVPTMTAVCWYLPKEEIKKYWATAWNQITEKLSSEKSFPIVIGGHAIYYSGEREEFFSPVDIGLLKSTISNNKLRVTRVIVLIDDVYDMYYRLTAKDEIFSFKYMSDRLEELLRDNLIIEGKSMPQHKRIIKKHYLNLETKYWIAEKLLKWRANELATAEIISRELGARFTVFAVKQRKDVFLRLVRDEKAPVVYISHPITRIRSEIVGKWAAGGSYSWPEVHAEINRLPSELLDSGIICISPTGIDELRIYIPEENDRPGRLSPRWGLQTDLVWKPPPKENDRPVAGSAPDFFDFPACDSNLNELDTNSQLILFERQKTLLRHFFTQIVEQLAARDHLLVEHSDAILVYRGLYNSTAFSAGVNKELKYWQKTHTSSSGRKSRVIFVHFRDDITKLAPDLFLGYVSTFKDLLREHLARKFYDIEDSVVEEFLARLSQGRESGTPVGHGPDPTVLRKLIERKKDLLREVILQWLTAHLTSHMARHNKDFISVRVIRPGVSIKALDLGKEIERNGPNLDDLEKLADELLDKSDYQELLDAI
jgi:hypothetical protein